MRDFFKVVRIFPGKNDLKIVGIFILIFVIFRFLASSDVGIQLCNFFVILGLITFSVIVFGCFLDWREIKYIEDIDGNRYAYVSIGDLDIMIENLKVKTYNDGKPIPLIDNLQIWDEIRADAMYQDKSKISGVFYNFNAIDTGKLAPEGWRVPSDIDWKRIESLGMSDCDVNERDIRCMAWRFYIKLYISGRGFLTAKAPDSENFLICHSDIGSSYFWTSSSVDDYAWIRAFKPVRGIQEVGVNRMKLNKGCGLFVRCVRENKH